MSNTLRPLAALAMVAVISAGCGGTRSSGGTSTAAPAGNTGTASSTGTGSGGGTNAASPHAKAVKFAECMRANGVKQVLSLCGESTNSGTPSRPLRSVPVSRHSISPVTWLPV
jgi:hypothetical protein